MMEDIENFVKLIKDFREDSKKLIKLFEGVSVDEMIEEMRRFNNNLEQVDLQLLITQIRQLNNVLDQVNIRDISRIADAINMVDINELQQNIKFMLTFAKQLGESEEKSESKVTKGKAKKGSKSD